MRRKLEPVLPLAHISDSGFDMSTETVARVESTAAMRTVPTMSSGLISSEIQGESKGMHRGQPRDLAGSFRVAASLLSRLIISSLFVC